MFDAILRTPTRICEAKFGNLWLVRGRRLPHRRAARRAGAYREYPRRKPVRQPEPGNALGRACATKQGTSRSPTSRKIMPTTGTRSAIAASRRSLPARARSLAVPMLKDGDVIGVHRHLPPGGAAVHRQADRAGAELRRPGRDRHREHAAAQRAAPAHRRSHRIAGAADRDLRGAEGHQPARPASWSRCSTRMLENATASARPSSAIAVPTARASLPLAAAVHGTAGA